MTARDQVIQLTKQDDEIKQYEGRSLLQLAVQRLRRDRLTLAAMGVVAIIAVLAILAPVITYNILQLNHIKTDPVQSFLPPGGAQRLVSDPDYRFRSQSVQVGITYDTLAKIKMMVADLSIKDMKAGMGAVRLFHAAVGTKSLNLTFSGVDQTGDKPTFSRLGFGKVSDLQHLPAGTYDLRVNLTADPNGTPLVEMKGVEIAAGTFTALVGYGDAAGGTAFSLAQQMVNVTDLPEKVARVVFMNASPDSPRLDVQINNKTIHTGLAYTDKMVQDVPQQTAMFSAVDHDGSRTHFLGTDDLGRDQFVRLLYAGQVSLGIGLFAALISIFIGVLVGIITGYYGGLIDDLVNWLITTINSLPTLLLLLILVKLLKPGPLVLILVLGLLGWIGTARLVRGETLSIRAREYIVSARSIGAPVRRIMLVHILPNLLSVVLITLAIDIGALILTESALSYLGFGIDSGVAPSWGNMLSNAQTFFTKGQHLVIVPGLMITVTVLCLYIIGDGLRDAFDPTLKA